MTNKTVNILGIRGIPAAHGGFETFAARLAPYLRDRGWRVNVYCQITDLDPSKTPLSFEDEWEGIHRIHFGSNLKGSAGTIHFDWQCVKDVVRRPGIDLTLGYNTAIFAIYQRIMGRQVLMNMDGIEWKRAKWSLPVKAWFYFNEFLGANLSQVPIADHPVIAKHLRRHGCKNAVVIPYGADAIDGQDVYAHTSLGLESKQYYLSISRIEPENSIFEIVSAYSKHTRRKKLVILGRLDPDNSYHNAVLRAASNDVFFPGAIYEPAKVSSLRTNAFAYLHGHQVGGTNPSLVEALAAGNLVIAHDNPFNRWVAEDSQEYFSSVTHLDAILSRLDEETQVTEAQERSLKIHHDRFQWGDILAQYEALLEERLRYASSGKLYPKAQIHG